MSHRDDQVRIRLADADDCPAIIDLNRVWLKVGDTDADRRHGFLFGAPYQPDDILRCIREQTIVVAHQGACLIGYYLLDDWSENATTNAYRAALLDLQEKGLAPTSQICCRAQVAIARSHHGSGLYRLLHTEIARHACGRFRHAFSVVSKYNPKYGAHLRLGVRLLAEDDALAYVAIDLIGQSIVEGPVAAADEPGRMSILGG